MAEKELTRTQKLGQARNKATQRLIAAKQEEFNTLMQQEAEALGEQWSPRKSEEDRARETVQQLLRDYPSLAGQITAVTGVESATVPTQFEQMTAAETTTRV